MKKLLLLLTLMCFILTTGCSGGDKKPAVAPDAVSNDTEFEPQKPASKNIPYAFTGDLSKYYQARMCTATPLTTMELEAKNIQPQEDHHYYTISVGIERNGTPFDFKVDNIECMYDVWLVPTKFPAGKFNIHAQVVDTHNTRVAQLDFHNAVELKDLLKKCPNEGDFLVIEDVLDIERIFDRPSNKLDIRGYIKPVK